MSCQLEKFVIVAETFCNILPMKRMNRYRTNYEPKTLPSMFTDLGYLVHTFGKKSAKSERGLFKYIQNPRIFLNLKY
jgi:hypothetical protein